MHGQVIQRYERAYHAAPVCPTMHALTAYPVAVVASSRQRRVCPRCGAFVSTAQVFAATRRIAFDGWPTPVSTDRTLDGDIEVDLISRASLHRCRAVS